MCMGQRLYVPLILVCFFFIFAVLLVRHKYELSGTMSINEINIFI